MRVEVVSVEDFKEVGAGACFVFLVRQNSSKKSVPELRDWDRIGDVSRNSNPDCSVYK